MKQWVLMAAVLLPAAGCKSYADIFREREMLKLHVQNAQHNYHAGKYEVAVQQAQKALDIDPDHSKGLAILGYCYLQVARFGKTREARLEYYEKTESVFEHAIQVGSERDPAVFKAYFGLGLVCFMWAQEVKSMIEEASGKKPGLEIGDSDRGYREGIWSE
ncbi:MAG: hypothetical protein ACYTHM_13045 [Planctomycetota bacterium]|jgi:tetratricopeptide (TPR) repeat protein